MATILILSKLSKNLELMAEFFKKQGFDSISASSYEDLDRILSSLSFDVALLDIGGFDSKIWHYCEKINKHGTPFFIISAVKNPKIDKEGLKKGARGVLVKPLVMKELNEIIKALV
jgi:DNA-binding response OmpR family regulator